MHTTFAISVLLICECLTIRVPVAWDNGVTSEVQDENKKENNEFSVEEFKPKEIPRSQIPTEYFEYTAKKPQFAIDIAKQHGVNNPEQNFKAQAVRPHTGPQPPQLGIHHMLDEDKRIFNPYQKYVRNENLGHVKPVSNYYEVFHPYKAEEPALQAIYKDPVLAKIRNDLENSKNQQENYEKQAGEPNITADEYLEGQQQTDKRLFPHKNEPVQFEIHRPQRKPVYYRPPPKLNHRQREILNQRFKHPWNQNFVKIRPMHYRPLQNHIHNLRQHHAMKYDDDRNEYPQVQVAQDFAEPQDGYDIYEKGKERYEQLRDSVDESINKVVLENRPHTYQKLEIQNEKSEENNNEEDEFIPIKNYAQVRKTETIKHLPRAAAFTDAETFDEIRNAPRLREAVKSTKAQTVYTEEGYEDSAYDHAGEQKHASDHEGHGGYLKEKEISGGKYKIPSESDSFDSENGSEYRDQVLHGKKWKNNNKDNEEVNDSEDYDETEQEQLIEGEAYDNDSQEENGQRNKRNHNNTIPIDNKNTNDVETNSENAPATDHDVNKREINFKVPELNLNSTFLTEKDILDISKMKIETKRNEKIEEKYPYYFKDINLVSKHSPLKYAENLKFIPKKSQGGTEFYDSRTHLECPEIENVDPLPDKLKRGENPTESEEDEDEEKKSNKGEKNFNIIKEQPRLKGLGDKIDCFKAKYFGENPLDSPFFNEEIIANPEPVTLPSLPIYTLQKTKFKQDSANDDETQNKNKIFLLLGKLRKNEEGILNNIDQKQNSLLSNTTSFNNTQLGHQSTVHTNILEDINKNLQNSYNNSMNSSNVLTQDLSSSADNIDYKFYKNIEYVTKQPQKVRRKRAATFIYEPYKIIRDSQVQDSKKTTTTSNVSPLIKQLQSSRVVDKVSKDKESDKSVKRYVSTRTYKDIGKTNRSQSTQKEGSTQPSFVDVNFDQRRGEPRYEIRPANHKPEYTPVENKKAFSLEDYRSKTNTNVTLQTTESREERSTQPQIKKNSRQIRPTAKPMFDLSQYIPTSNVIENVAASNNVRRFITSSTSTVPNIESENIPKKEETEYIETEEDYNDYDHDSDDEEEVNTTTTTTTVKPTFRRRSRGTTTTSTTTEVPYATTTETPRLRLVTRFRDYNNKPLENGNISKQKQESKDMFSVNEDIKVTVPRYREKKKKTRKSTLVTDTKKYGDGNDDMRREEVDAMIGVKHDMDDYIPMYEKENNSKDKSDESSEESNDEFENSEEDEKLESEEELSEEEDGEEEEEEEPEPTTPEPTKRSLLRTTDAPVPTIPSRSAKLEIKPVVSKKKVEVHKELPVNKSSPHVTQFKQDIKEIEIVKVLPQKGKTQKNSEALELYKDDNLAKEINKLHDVEIFKEDLDLNKGPRHGGNYRSIEDVSELPAESISAKDAVASQSENTKHVELEEYTPKRMHGGNLKSVNDVKRIRNTGRNAKYTEISDTESTRPRAMHGGNLKYDSKPRRGNSRSEKLIELDDKDDDGSQDEDDYKTYGPRTGPMHGGNYRSAKLIAEDDIEVKKSGRDASKKGAVLLNSFAKAIPVLTTTPSFILDPSKRMYYYVET